MLINIKRSDVAVSCRPLLRADVPTLGLLSRPLQPLLSTYQHESVVKNEPSIKSN